MRRAARGDNPRRRKADASRGFPSLKLDKVGRCLDVTLHCTGHRSQPGGGDETERWVGEIEVSLTGQAGETAVAGITDIRNNSFVTEGVRVREKE